jgi:diaminopimelate decarboxylase
LETASIGEVIQALRCGCPPEKIVYDSPCKTAADIKFAIMNGVHINANSISEFHKIKEVLSSMDIDDRGRPASIGLRVNPLVGEGDIAELSTATFSSKFGVPLTEGTRGEILSLFRENLNLTGLMCHVGSQGK